MIISVSVTRPRRRSVENNVGVFFQAVPLRPVSLVLLEPEGIAVGS